MGKRAQKGEDQYSNNFNDISHPPLIAIGEWNIFLMN